MVKFIAICLFLSILFNVLGYGYITILREENNALESEKKALKIKIEEIRYDLEKSSNARNDANKKISKIKTVVKTVKSVCDCYNSRIDDSILNILHNRRNKK